MFEQGYALCTIRQARFEIANMQDELAEIEKLLSNPALHAACCDTNARSLSYSKEGLLDARKYFNKAIRDLIAQVDDAIDERNINAE